MSVPVDKELRIFNLSDLESIKIGGVDFTPTLLRLYWVEMPRLLLGSFLIGFLILYSYYLLAGGNLILSGLVLGGAIVPTWAGFVYIIGKAALEFIPKAIELARAVRYFYFRSILLVLPAVLLAMLFTTSVGLLGSSLPIVVIIGIIVQLFVLCYLITLAIYGIPLMVLFDISVWQSLRKSLALVIRSPFSAVLLLSSAFSLAFLADLFSPLGWLLFGFLFGPFAVCSILAQAQTALINNE